MAALTDRQLKILAFAIVFIMAAAFVAGVFLGIRR
jgi:hypothetical protein